MKINKRTEDLTGLDFDKLKVKAFAGYKNGAAQWFCECMCGTYKEYYAYNLKNGHTILWLFTKRENNIPQNECNIRV